jgi:small basic protein
MAIWLPVAGLLIGILVGNALGLSFPPDLARYTALAVLAGLDAIVGAARATLEQRYDNELFISGLVSNMILAALLTFVGDRLGFDLSIAAVVAFGVRLFNNVAAIRRILLGVGQS